MMGIIAAALTLVLLGSVTSVGATERHKKERAENEYVQTDLVSDVPGRAQTVDPNLVNPWGMSAAPTSPLWVADNGTNVSTLYQGAVPGTPISTVPLVVAIPGGAPTGTVFNPSPGFVVSDGTTSAPARFLFASEGGQITAWSPMVPPITQARLAVTTPDAVYKGLALATTSAGATLLYAANFHAGTIDVFDSAFMPVSNPDAFVDPKLPKGFAPFNVQEIQGRIYVTYAKQNADRTADVPGAGNGFVSVFTPEGKFIRRLVSRFPLNSPWGITIAPDGFGKFSGALLVGNFGDGRIHAFDAGNGRFLGTLRDQNHKRITIDGLWGLRFGNGVYGTPTTLFFTAGPDGETHGLLGTLVPEPEDED